MSRAPDYQQFNTSNATRAGRPQHREIDVVLRDQLTGCFPQAGLGAAAARVAWVLMHSYNAKEGFARPSREVIADEIGTSVRQADNLIAEVLDFGLFTHESGRQHHANRYYPNWPLIDRMVPPDGDRQMYAVRRAAFRARKAVQALETDLNGNTPKRSRRKPPAQPKLAADAAGVQRQMTSRAEDPCIQTGNFLPPDLKLSASRQEETCIQTGNKLLPNPSMSPDLETGSSNPSLGNPDNDAAGAPPVGAPVAARLGEDYARGALYEGGPAGKIRPAGIRKAELQDAYDRLLEVWPGSSDPIGEYEDHKPALGRLLMRGWTIEQILACAQGYVDAFGALPEVKIHVMTMFRRDFGLQGPKPVNTSRPLAPLRPWDAGLDDDDEDDREDRKRARRFPSRVAEEHAPF